MSNKKRLRVLIVDDDNDILELLEYNLEKEGFKVKTLIESCDAIEVAKNFSPALIILDIMMPHPNGIELCREFRSMKKFTDTYIFFLTAKSEDYYLQAAFDTGGDDYIEKIIGLRALTNKVNTVLKKRFVIRKCVPELVVGKLKINRKAGMVSLSDRHIYLSKPEFEVLFFLAQNSGKIVTRENLLSNIWGSEFFLFDLSIEGYIENLRKKIGIDLIQCLDNNRYRLEKL